MNEASSLKIIRGNARVMLMDHMGSCVGITMIYLLLLINSEMFVNILPYSATIGGVLFISLANYLVHVVFRVIVAGRAHYFTSLNEEKAVGVSTLFYGFRSRPGRIIAGAVITEGIRLIFALPALISSVIPVGEGTIWSAALITAALYLAGASLSALALLPFMPLNYILTDFTNMAVGKALRMSFWLMKGNKLRLIRLYLSYLPLMIVSVISFGIGFIWISPLMQNAYAAFYLNLIKEKQQ